MLFVNFFEVIARFIDDIGFHVLQPIRAIRFHEFRDFISEKYRNNFFSYNSTNYYLFNF